MRRLTELTRRFRDALAQRRGRRPLRARRPGAKRRDRLGEHRRDPVRDGVAPPRRRVEGHDPRRAPLLACCAPQSRHRARGHRPASPGVSTRPTSRSTPPSRRCGASPPAGRRPRGRSHEVGRSRVVLRLRARDARRAGARARRASGATRPGPARGEPELRRRRRVPLGGRAEGRGGAREREDPLRGDPPLRARRRGGHRLSPRAHGGRA